MSPVQISELTSHVRAVESVPFHDPKLIDRVRKAVEQVAKLEKERAANQDDDAAPPNSDALLQAIRTAAKAAADVVSACDDTAHQAVQRAMERLSEAGKKRAKEIAAEDAKRKKDEK